MTRTLDFDSFRRERAAEPIDFVIDGKTYKLPSAIPASLAVDVIKMQNEIGAEADIPVEKLEMFGQGLFGPTIWKQLLEDHGITVDELSPLLEMVMGAYTDAPKAETEPTTEPEPDWTPQEVASI